MQSKSTDTMKAPKKRVPEAFLRCDTYILLHAFLGLLQPLSYGKFGFTFPATL